MALFITKENNQKPASKSFLLMVVFVASAFGILIYYFVFRTTKSEFDFKNKSNAKIIPVLDSVLKIQTNEYTHFEDLSIEKTDPRKYSKAEIKAYNEALNKYNTRTTNGCDGCIPEAKENAEKFVQSISKMETYARYGVNSNQARNSIYLKLTLNDGSVIDEIRTDGSAYGGMSAPVLFTITLENGKTKQVLTNGVELRSSPTEVFIQLNSLVDKMISHDAIYNQNKYYPKAKNAADFKKEWNDM